ncbi:MAG: TIGR01777 family oxidoreductase [Flavobacteriales bacterium]
MNILITGGTGLIGKRLTEILLSKGHEVSILSRSKKQSEKVTFYTWDIAKQEIEKVAIQKADYIIHLAGANVGEGRWTDKRKKEIIDSRVQSGYLLLDAVKEHNPNLKGFISSSAVGYYGMVTKDKVFEETDKPGVDFLAKVCEKWENTALKFKQLNIRTVIIRTGVVLDKNDGALAKLLTPIKLGIGSGLGTGNQAMPWIHLEDICNLYVHAIENEGMKGAYNGVAPEQVTNQEFSKTVAKVLKKPFWFPNVPTFALKLLMGEQAIIALEGSPISSKKTEATGFKYKYRNLKDALEDLLKK